MLQLIYVSLSERKYEWEREFVAECEFSINEVFKYFPKLI